MQDMRCGERLGMKQKSLWIVEIIIIAIVLVVVGSIAGPQMGVADSEDQSQQIDRPVE